MECVTAARYVTGDGLTLVRKDGCSFCQTGGVHLKSRRRSGCEPASRGYKRGMGIFRRDRRKQSTTRETLGEVGSEIAVEVAVTGVFRVLRGIVHAILHAFA